MTYTGIYRDDRGRPSDLYRLFDGDDRCLYIGVSSNIRTRMLTHAREKHWWPDVAWCSVESFPEGWQALDAERAAIHHETPLHNKRSRLAVS